MLHEKTLHFDIESVKRPLYLLLALVFNELSSLLRTKHLVSV